MIQASYNKPIELPAPKAELPKSSAASSSSKSEYSKKSNGVDKRREKSEFESELKAAGADKESSEPKVKEVKVSEGQRLEKPSSLVNPEGSESDSIQQSVFDPAVTHDVEKAINPKSVQVEQLTDEQVLALANGEVDPALLTGEIPAEEAIQAELAQAMLKTPKLNGRSPAIDFEKAEVDPNLMSMEDFVAQKNMVTKKPAGTNAYGAQKPQAQKIALENGLKQNQVITDMKALDGQSNQPMNAQQFILNMKSESGSPKINEAAPMKTFDMSHIKTENSEKIMNQISDYIVQAKASSQPTVTMRVNHEELGMIDITVQKSGMMNAESLAISIGAHSTEGKNFFQANTKELFSHMANAGMNVSDLKVDSPSQSAKNDFDMNGGHRQSQNSGSEKQFGSEQNQRRSDSDRRQDLWKLLNKEAA